MTEHTDDDLEALAAEAEEEAQHVFVRRRRRMQDFRYDESQEKFWDVTTGLLLGAKSVDGAIPREWWPTRPDGRNGQPRPFNPSIAINDVDTGLTVEGATWWPGRPKFIEDYVITARGAIKQKGAVAYNTYIPVQHDDLRTDKNPDPWIDHVKFLYPDPEEHEHFFDFAAHMIQRPDEKVNHGVVMAGSQGIGKDTALLPLRRGVGEWNCAEIEPDAIHSQYNTYVKSVLLVINEVRPHDEDFKASNFYNQLKPLLAAPPEMLPMEAKYANVVYVRNLCHTVLTTNDPLTMYIPEEDRRLFVMTSLLPDPKKTPVFPADYFENLHQYLEDGGCDSVIRWLMNRNIMDFNPAAPPKMTAGKQAVINSASEVRRTPLHDFFDFYSEHLFTSKKPEIVFASDLLQFLNQGPMFDDRDQVMKLIKSKSFHFKMDSLGYDLYKNPYGSEWKNGKFRSRAAFVAKSIPNAERFAAVSKELERRPLEMSRGE